ncbi:unnamed protein product [Didymodactylos carnosus]|uniref:G-protein coupled receptors family 1 profile domain-containing protein n=1 Tax=Didymodactylos carnosus TaxID=1234261 RepID=A0A813ZD90_9BILA|nr:unnamed protein product [Didymodactylos carnosus]CAF3681375.1 unnamed protein product [Didymodactylos carnosus]
MNWNKNLTTTTTLFPEITSTINIYTTTTITNYNHIVKISFGEQLKNACKLFRFYASIFLIIIGMIGSILSIKVFSSTKIRRNSSNEYLITMSFVVVLLLFNFFCDEILRSIVNDFEVDLPLNLVDLSKLLCKTSTYLRHTLRFAAHWIVVAFTLERLIVVHFPLHTSILCTPRCAKRVCLFILIMSFLVPFYSFIMSDVIPSEQNHQNSECDIMKKYNLIYLYLTIIYGNLTLTFPILIVCIVNILIVRQLLKAANIRKKNKNLQYEEAQLDAATSTILARNSKLNKSNAAENEYYQSIVKNQLENDKVTWMLVVISVTFGILNFPYFILWCYICVIRVRGKTPTPFVESAKLISEVLHLLNYSTYFFLYVISRRSFRKVLVEKMRCRCDCFEQWRLYEMRSDVNNKIQNKKKISISQQQQQQFSNTNTTHIISSNNTNHNYHQLLVVRQQDNNIIGNDGHGREKARTRMIIVQDDKNIDKTGDDNKYSLGNIV